MTNLTAIEIETLRLCRSDVQHVTGWSTNLTGGQLDACRKLCRETPALIDWRIGRGYYTTDAGRAVLAELGRNDPSPVHRGHAGAPIVGTFASDSDPEASRIVKREHPIAVAARTRKAARQVSK